MKASVLLIALLGVLATPVMAAEMVMFEQPGCAWCKRFNEEIAPAWPNTEQGKRAPLRRVNIHDDIPSDLAGIPVERFTPRISASSVSVGSRSPGVRSPLTI